MTMRPTQIHTFSCYRTILTEFFTHKRKSRTGFSYRRFAKLVGLKSPNYLQLVMQGKRNLSVELGERIADAMGLSPAEQGYFVGLVRRELARGMEEETQASRALEAAARQLLTRRLSGGQLELLSRWYYLPIRELVFLKDFQPTGEYISRKLGGMVSSQDAERALAFLLQRGFILRDFEKGFVVPDVVLDTGDHVLKRSALDLHHTETLGIWEHNLAKFSAEDQERGLLNIPISSERIPELKERMRKFQYELIGWVQSDTTPDRLVQVGIYCFSFPK